MESLGGIIQYAAALSAGVAAFCIALFVMRAMGRIDTDGLEVNAEFYHQLPPLLRLGRVMSRPFMPLAREKSLENIRQITARKLGMGGYGESISTEEFVAVKLYYYCVGAIVFLLCLAIDQPIFGIVLGALFGVYPALWLNAVIKARHLSMLKALPNVLDLLTLSVEAGKDFVTSLRDILARRRIDPLGEELMRAFQEIQLGRKRSDALRDLAKRVNQNELTSVIDAIIQAEELGVSIGNLLRIQGDLLRNKRFTLAEKLANEAPVKIIIPIVAFIFPAVLLILAGPIILQVMDMFGQ